VRHLVPEISRLRGGKTMRRRARVILVACAALAAATSVQANHREAKLYVITDWPFSGLTCSANDVPDWDDMTLAWYNELKDHAYYFGDGVWTNGSLSRKQLCDPDSGKSPCTDYDRVDDADAAMIALHGADSNNHWAGSLLVETDGSCQIHAAEGASTDALFVGDKDLEFLHLSSCYSMNDDNINYAKHIFEDVDSASTGRRLHQLDGFHGVMAISSSRDGDYEDFADDGHYTSLADAWTDNMYDPDVSYSDGDGAQCPVALAIGSNEADAMIRLTLENYTSSFPDPTSNNYLSYQFYDHCRPYAEDSFNDPNS
jgi:hypothetical protein